MTTMPYHAMANLTQPSHAIPCDGRCTSNVHVDVSVNQHTDAEAKVSQQPTSSLFTGGFSGMLRAMPLLTSVLPLVAGLFLEEELVEEEL